MVEALGITIDRRSNARLRKTKSETREKIGCITILIKKIEGEKEK